MEINGYLLEILDIVKGMDAIELVPSSVDLSKTEFRLLREIMLEQRKGKDIISSELARRIGVTRSAISQIVTKLEKSGVVKRVASPTDRKIAYVRISEETCSKFEKSCGQANRLMERVVEVYGEERMNELIASCKEFVQIVTKINQDGVSEE